MEMKLAVGIIDEIGQASQKDEFDTSRSQEAKPIQGIVNSFTRLTCNTIGWLCPEPLKHKMDHLKSKDADCTDGECDFQACVEERKQQPDYDPNELDFSCEGRPGSQIDKTPR